MSNRLGRLLAAGTALLGWSAGALACVDPTPCELENGRYFVRPPRGWDGTAKLPLVVYFHGYRSSARDVMDDKELVRALSEAGALLVAPDGRTGSWTIPGALSTGRDDVAFVREVVADVSLRYPVDSARTLASGFSAGGFIVWAIACRAGDVFAAYAPIAGSFLDPIPADCRSGPVSLRHVHGLSDETVPMAGRWIAGERVRQSDLDASIARLRKVDGCPDLPSFSRTEDGLTCRTWSSQSCSGGKEIVLCLHGGGHEAKAKWVVDALNWLTGLPATARRTP